MEGLLTTLLNLISLWANSFQRKKSAARAKDLCLSFLLPFGKKLLSKSLMVTGRDQLDWSAAYKFFSRTSWSPCALFRPILQKALELVDEDVIAVGFDDTLTKKTGKKIKGTWWIRDSASPHFCHNFVWGMRFLQASLLLPLYQRQAPSACRGIPVQFTQLPRFKKPRKSALKEEWERYKHLTQKYNSSTTFVKELRYLRNDLHTLGYKSQRLLAVVDASYVNRTTLLSEIPGTDIVGRVRKTARFFFKSKVKKGKQFYEKESYTAEELRRRDDVKYETFQAHYAGSFKDVRFKEYPEIYWRWGTKRKTLRLIIIAPTPYRRTQKSRREYRDPAYLLTTNFDLPAETLIQKYLDRWQIEVNFKEEKSQMSLGKQQVWSERSIPRAPAFIAVSYAALLLAGVLCFSESRNSESFTPSPKWREKGDRRPSFADLMTVLRREVCEKGFNSTAGPAFKISFADLVQRSAG